MSWLSGLLKTVAPVAASAFGGPWGQVAGALLGGALGKSGGGSAANRTAGDATQFQYGLMTRYVPPLASLLERRISTSGYSPYRAGAGAEVAGIREQYDQAAPEYMRTLAERGLGRSSLATQGLASLMGGRASAEAEAVERARARQRAEQTGDIGLLSQLISGTGATGLAATAGNLGAQQANREDQENAGLAALLQQIFTRAPQAPGRLPGDLVADTSRVSTPSLASTLPGTVHLPGRMSLADLILPPSPRYRLY